MIKVFPPRFEPDWLASVSEEHPLPLSDLLQNSLYYPASRLDGDPVRYFAGFLHSFVYADSSISKEAITEDLYRRGHGFTGYRVRFVPVQLKVEFWAKEKGKSCRRNNQEQDNEARAAKLERRGKDPGVAPAFD